jgi:hypothetical protein
MTLIGQARNVVECPVSSAQRPIQLSRRPGPGAQESTTTPRRGTANTVHNSPRAHEPKNPGGQGALDLRGTVRRNSDGAGGTAGVGVGFALESS